ncbi:HNH endonuclease [Paenibacillus sp. W2I17]|uniref:HNH endonuclease n=1 Tax=Paenibacillus sp. W2I17 TaxID=3042311 RepID=UPI0027892BD9|nr:HNH endonuclease signature motif containing protein [Paenibacillus sp. W2I17]MDQ0657835.1 hypothetical protein [Paenibacillus sp. W2I17]
MRIDESYKTLKLNYAYQIASLASDIIISKNIDEKFNEYLWFFERDRDEYFSELVQGNEIKLQKPHKESILYNFISDLLVMILTKKEYWFVDDFYNFEHEEIESYILQNFIEPLEVYNPKINKYRSILEELETQSTEENRDQYEEKIKDIISEIMDLFIAGNNSIEDETFYLLFNDKLFLYYFNELLSEYVSESECININRVRVPTWLKKGVFFRDNGRCQNCSRDLSGIINVNPERGLHFDHIVSLENGGSNDPTNFQLLCSDCNLKKSTKNKKPKLLYQFYW